MLTIVAMSLVQRWCWFVYDSIVIAVRVAVAMAVAVAFFVQVK